MYKESLKSAFVKVRAVVIFCLKGQQPGNCAVDEAGGLCSPIWSGKTGRSLESPNLVFSQQWEPGNSGFDISEGTSSSNNGKVNWMTRGKANQGNSNVSSFHQVSFYLGCYQKVPPTPVGLSISVKVSFFNWSFLIYVVNIKTNYHNPPSVN